MKRTLLLWKLEWKHTLKLLPGMLLEALLLLAIIVAVAFAGTKFFYQNTQTIQITIAVVEEEENPMTDLMLQYIQGMESISDSCQFLTVSREEGFRMLQEQEAAAVMILPKQMVEGILNGSNMPVQVYFPEDAGMESALLKELTDAGVGMLRVAQAEIYGIYDTAEEFGALEHLSVLQADINQKNLAFALDRMALFKTQTVSATGNLTMIQHFLVSGLIFFLLLLGMACYPMMQPYSQVMSKQLSRQGIGVAKQCFGKWMCGFGSLTIGLACIVAAKWIPELEWQQFGILLLMLLCVSTFVFMVFQMAGNGVAAILLLFFLSTVMMYCSGGFLPTVFLPEGVQTIGKVLPTTYLIELTGSLYTGTVDSSVVGVLLGYTLVFGGISYAIRKGEKG